MFSEDEIEELVTTVGAAIGAWLAMKLYQKISTEVQVWYHMRTLDMEDAWRP